MARARKLKPQAPWEHSLVPAHCATVQVPAGHRASWLLRGEALRLEIADRETVFGQKIGAEFILYFAPDIEAVTGKGIDWIVARIDAIRAGRNCSQEVFARLVPVFWRLPRGGWRFGFPSPPNHIEELIPHPNYWRFPVCIGTRGRRVPFPPVFARSEAEAA